MPQPKIVTYEEVRTRTAELMRAMTRLPIVGISGHGGAGKSTLAARLVTDLGGTAEQVISTDCFYAAGAGAGSGLFGLHDWPALLGLLGRLRAAPTPLRLVYPVRNYDGTERTCDVPMPDRKSVV